MDEELAPEEHGVTAAFVVGEETTRHQTMAPMDPPLALPDEQSQPTDGASTADPRTRARMAHRIQHARTVYSRQLLDEWREQERRALARQEYARRAPARPLPPQRPQILVVSHVEETRDALAAFLAREGYAVSLARDREEAQRIVAQTVPTLVLWELPPALRDNRGLVAALRERGIIAPVLLLAASPSGKVWAKHLGAAGALSKPLDYAALRMMVAGLMSATE